MLKVKVCGITKLDDAILACSLGAWAIGFIFYPKSKRYINPIEAEKIASTVKKYNVKTIGVFVNEDIETINKISSIVSLDYIQMHGIETKETCAKLNKPFIKNIRNIAELEQYSSASYYLIDANDINNWGGTGKLADWEFAHQIKKLDMPLMLSGGLNTNNIEEAVFMVNPDIIDISSSIEETPGIKNHKLMKDFFDKIKKVGG